MILNIKKIFRILLFAIRKDIYFETCFSDFGIKMKMIWFCYADSVKRNLEYFYSWNLFNRLCNIYIYVYIYIYIVSTGYVICIICLEYIDEMCLTSCLKCENILIMKAERTKDMGWSNVSNPTEQSWHNLELISAPSGGGLRNPNTSFWTHVAMWSQFDWRSKDSFNLHGRPCKCENYNAYLPWLRKKTEKVLLIFFISMVM